MPWIRHLPTALLLAGLCAGAPAAPRLPGSDAEVVERVPARIADPRMRELAALRAHWRAAPDDPARAAALARQYVAQALAEGDPRFVGYAQSALQPWWDRPDAPPEVLVQRAVLQQFGHRFDAAQADLELALKARPDDAEAWAWRAAIDMVRADFGGARRACERLAPLTTPLIGTACIAYADSMSGRAAPAARALRAALAAEPETEPSQRLWALTRLAEIEERRGAFAQAEAAYREALALGHPDVYLLSAWADFLLDRGRAAEVVKLLGDQTRADALLLRLAIAAKAVAAPDAQRWNRELASRFDAARARGDTTHRKEEARFALAVQGDAPRALGLARDNWAQQREAADARVLLEAALAARDPQAASPVLAWMASSRVESVALDALATQLKGLQ